MRNVCILAVGCLFWMLGCQRPQEPSVCARPAPADMDIALDNADAWKHVNGFGLVGPIREHGSVQLLWDEKYLYARMHCYTHEVLPETLNVRLSFDIGKYTNPRVIIISSDGRCFDPNVSNVGLVQMESQEAVARAVLTKREWTVQARISLTAVRAIGHDVVLTANLRGVRALTAKEAPGPFDAGWTGKVDFKYPNRPRPTSKPVQWSELMQPAVTR